MASVLHIAEVAAILAVAYALGWVLGYYAHQLSGTRRVAVTAGVPAERIAAVTGSVSDAVAPPPPAPEPVPAQEVPAMGLVVIDLALPTEPVPAEPTSTVIAAPAPVVAEVAAPVPEPLPEATIVPIAAEPLPVAPAPEPAATTTIAPVVTARFTPTPPRTRPPLPPIEVPPLQIDPMPPLRKITPVAKPAPTTTTPEPEHEIVLTAAPALKPGEAWRGAIRGRAASEPKPEPKPAVEVFNEPSPEVPFTLELTETIAFVAESEAAPAEAHVEAHSTDAESVPFELVEPEAVPFELVEPEPEPIAPQPVVAPPQAAEPVHDEDAAMRAIEGGWSRVKARALTGEPEISDAGAAVAAAQTAVEQVLAKAGIDVENSQRASRPTGLAGPRAGRKDDLKRIDGVGALDESTLNNLGVYHFDQIAGWDNAQVLWMENHVFARGRIGRENWQQQARDLASA